MNGDEQEQVGFTTPPSRDSDPTVPCAHHPGSTGASHPLDHQLTTGGSPMDAVCSGLSVQDDGHVAEGQRDRAAAGGGQPVVFSVWHSAQVQRFHRAGGIAVLPQFEQVSISSHPAGFARSLGAGSLSGSVGPGTSSAGRFGGLHRGGSTVGRNRYTSDQEQSTPYPYYVEKDNKGNGGRWRCRGAVCGRRSRCERWRSMRDPSRRGRTVGVPARSAGHRGVRGSVGTGCYRSS
jgi:hypothetical protein